MSPLRNLTTRYSITTPAAEPNGFLKVVSFLHELSKSSFSGWAWEECSMENGVSHIVAKVIIDVAENFRINNLKARTRLW